MMSEVTIANAAIPECIAMAVLETQKALGVLGKEGRNTFQDYSYVSIDKYYEIVAQAARANDLSWFCKEVGSELVDMGGGKRAIKFDYVFTLFYGTGEVVPAYDRISIYHPLQGAQTSGSAASYAEKLFMRKAFKVVTGEEDADAADQSYGGGVECVPENTEGAPAGEKQPAENAAEALPPSTPVVEDPPKAPKQTTNEKVEPKINPNDYIEENEEGAPVLKEIKNPDAVSWDIIFAVFEAFIPGCETVKKTREFWSSNTKVIELLKEGSPKLHEKLVALFKEHQSQVSISKKGKK